jgi:dipeptidyl aminopeptidase/acylaminoacyl peptidase
VTLPLCLALLLPSRVSAQQRPEYSSESFTLAAILSAPFPSGLVAAPEGRAVAWIGYEEGRRNVWVAEAPAWRARRLTRYAQDDGQELSDLVWTADSRALLYTRGGDSDGNWGETLPANPTSDPRGTDQAVWLVPVKGGGPRRIGEGHAPVPSPRGDQVVFLLRDTLRTAPVERAGAPQVLLRLRGATSDVQWSPDGRRLAFVSGREDHSFVGVYDVASRAVRWMSPGTWRDATPRWSPDGKSLGFIRRAGLPYRTGPALPPIQGDGFAPFAIRVADPATGASREAWRSPNSPDGGLPEMAGEWGLLWAAGDQLLFASEQTGWLGLYRVGAQGGEAVRLTPTGCEVEQLGLSRDRASVIYSSNCGDVDRRHVQRVRVDGGAATDVTSGTGIEWLPQEVADGRIVLFKSDARRPAAPAITDSSGVTALAGWPLPAAFPEELLVEPQKVIFRAADSTEIHGQLFLPPDSAQGRLPAVIFFHGGPSRQMMLGWHNRGYYHNSYAFNQYLASRGFVVLSVNYRGGIMYGRAFRQAPRRGRFGASEYADALAAAEWLRARPDVDTAHVGLWGGSYGGYLTALGLARNSDRFAAGFDLHGVHDYAEESNLTRTFGVSDSAIAIARRSSPIGDVATWRSPVLFVAGDDDRNVQFRQTVDLAVRLRRQGVRVEELIFPDDIHDFLRHANWLAAYRAGAGLFADVLRR